MELLVPKVLLDCGAKVLVAGAPKVLVLAVPNGLVVAPKLVFPNPDAPILAWLASLLKPVPPTAGFPWKKVPPPTGF